MTDRNRTPLGALLDERSIRLDATARDRDDAVVQVGQALVDAGAVDPEYIASMAQRERAVSTYLGEGVAVPHGMLAGSRFVERDAISVVRFPNGVDWSDADHADARVWVCIGIAATGSGHIALLARLATILLDPVAAERLRAAETAKEVYALLDTATD
jgi:PTS system mannitol-specific IIA component